MPDNPHDESPLWKFIRHAVDEMSWKMVYASGLIAFFFFYGATNALIKLSGRNLATFAVQPGPIVGLGCAGLVLIAAVSIKLRPRD
ncbi:MAG: hypothetical protein ACO3DQ_02635 [Cephaloticoccus sp.]